MTVAIGHCEADSLYTAVIIDCDLLSWNMCVTLDNQAHVFRDKTQQTYVSQTESIIGFILKD